MATVYAAPEGYEYPDYDVDSSHEENQKKIDATTERLKVFCKEQSNCPHAGEVIGFPIADGQAQYMIFDYKSIIHLPIMDAWHIDDAHARGLRKADLIQKVEQRKALDEMFGRNQ